MAERMYHIVMDSWPDQGLESRSLHSLNQLIKKGWNPVREIPLGGGPFGSLKEDQSGMAWSYAALVLLERD